MGNEVSIAVRPLMLRLQPWQIVRAITRDDRVLTSEGRIAHHRIEARILPREQLRELDHPVKWS
jgi:hypothetical protein